MGFKNPIKSNSVIPSGQTDPIPSSWIYKILAKFIKNVSIYRINISPKVQKHCTIIHNKRRILLILQKYLT